LTLHRLSRRTRCRHWSQRGRSAGPGLRGVRAIVADADGKLGLGPADAPAAIADAVEMLRLPEERTAADATPPGWPGPSV